MIKTYIGKVCGKHPELKGLRAKNRQCRQCFLDSKKRCSKKGRNRDKYESMMYSRLRKQNMLKTIPAWADKAKTSAIYAARKEGEQVDHVIPLKGICPLTRKHVVCGLHVHTNLRIVSAKDNNSKWAWWDVEKQQ